MKRIAFYLLTLCSPAIYGQIHINEIFANNEAYVFDPETEKFPDYIELYNSGETAVDLAGYSLTDIATMPKQWVVPVNTLIAAKSTKLLWADGKDTGLHTNFKLSNKGEFLGLFDANGKNIDQVTFDQQIENVSYGRWPDGSDVWKLFTEPTPGAINLAPRYPTPPTKPDVNISAGFYGSAQTIVLQAQDDAVIHFTIDGSDPTTKSPIYSEQIAIGKTTIVKAIAVVDGKTSPMLVASFFINERTFDLPIVSLSFNDEHFFSDKTGIYVIGTNGSVGRCMDNVAVNWNMDWERPVSFEYFSALGLPLIQKQTNARIMGGCSRMNAQKSLTLVAAEGNFDYPFFKDRQAKSYKSIVLRNSGNDWGGTGRNELTGAIESSAPGTMLRDAFIQTLVKDQMDIDMQEYQPVALFMNGKYWGLINMREHLTENYLENIHPDIDKDNVDLIKNYWDVKEGDSDAWEALQKFLTDNSLADDANYEIVANQIDIDEFINYQLVQIYVSNDDWPGNNIRVWREKKESGKWRFILFDTDFGFGIWEHSAYNNSVANALAVDGPGWPNPPYSTLMFRRLMENDNFKHEFIQRMIIHMQSTFAPNHVQELLTAMKNTISKEMVYHLDRWYEENNTTEEWVERVDRMVSWGETRNAAMNDILQYSFSLQQPVAIAIDNSNDAIKSISVAGVALDAKANSFTCFPDIPIELNLEINDGFIFKRWETLEGEVLSQSVQFKYTATSATEIVPVFESRGEISGIHINEILASNKAFSTNETGASPDYIELFNSSDVSIDLSGLYITDDATNLLKYALPHNSTLLTIPANGFLRLWADGKPDLGADHLNWKISKNGGHIILTNRINTVNTIIDELQYNQLDENYSYGHFPDGANTLAIMVPTPLATNQLLSSSAVLYSFTPELLTLTPKFNPNQTDYTIAVPSGFSKDFPIVAVPYGNALVTELTESGVRTFTVTAEDKTATATYTVSLLDYVDVNNYIASLSVDGGMLTSSFDPQVTEYIITTPDETIPSIAWVLKDTNAVASIAVALAYSDTTFITVASANRGSRIYSFTFSTEVQLIEGYVENFDSVPDYVEIASSSYKAIVEDGKGHIDIKKTKPWDGILFDFNETVLDLSNYPYVQIGIASTSSCTLRMDLVDQNGISTNGAGVTKTVNANGFQTIIYDYSDKFIQSYPEPADCDPTSISFIWLCFGSGETGLNTTVDIEFIKFGNQVIFTKATQPVPQVYISSGMLIPAFDPEIKEYSIIDYKVIPQLFTTADTQDALIETEQFTDENSQAKTSISLLGAETLSYTFNLLPNGLSSNNDISSLSVKNGTLSPAFSPAVFDYQVTQLGYTTGAITVTLADQTAEYSVFQSKSLFQNSYILVTAQDGTRQVYTLRYTVPEDYPGLIDPQTLPCCPTECVDCIATGDEIQTIQTDIFPNPLINYLSFSGVDKATVKIYNTQGVLIATFADYRAFEQIDISGIESGTILVSVIGQTKTFNSIMIKE